MHNPNCDCTVEDCEVSHWSFIRYNDRGYPIFCICEHGNVIINEEDDLEKLRNQYGTR